MHKQSSLAGTLALGMVLLGMPGIPAAGLSEESEACLGCHQEETPALTRQWVASRHYGAAVGCYECHRAQSGDPDAVDHNGYTIAVLVTPRDCGVCHAREVDEFLNSQHAKAGRIIGSLDNILAEVVEGNAAFVTPGFPQGNSAAAVNGCWQCHGSPVVVLPDGGLDPATWPNSGIGRLNPDGSEGSCAACHQRHSFSSAQARRPENCGKCHLGPDHPQKEIYDESKHGIGFYANVEQMNLDARPWVAGQDYTAAPTCATCHMSANATDPVTHNVGLRIKWNNRPVHSQLSHVTDEHWGLAAAQITADQRRRNMQRVCVTCHSSNFTDAFFQQYEALLQLYEEKYAQPGEKLYTAAQPLLKTTAEGRRIDFAEPLDFIWFELWHHEGRRARHGAAMMAPDYSHWHGTYELARNFYSEYIPELEHLIAKGLRSKDKKKVAAARNLQRVVREILEDSNHRWYEGGE